MQSTTYPKSIILTSERCSLSDICRILSLNLTIENINSSNLKLSISPNDNDEWYFYQNNNWLSSTNIEKDGNTIIEFNNIKNNLNDILNVNDKKLIFKFYIELDNSLDIDNISYQIELFGISKVVDCKKFDIYYLNNKIMQCFSKLNIYQINY